MIKRRDLFFQLLNVESKLVDGLIQYGGVAVAGMQRGRTV
jgi:hypothetical protein